MCNTKELHKLMKTKVIELVNKEKGRQALAARAGCSESLISGIIDDDEYPTKKAFEMWFGELDLGDDHDEETEPFLFGLKVNDSEEPKQRLPFTIECEEYDKLVKTMESIGYEVKIVKD